jgi:hypothetical protein
MISSDMGRAIIVGFKKPTALIILTTATMCYVWMRKKCATNYNFIDRLLHRVAFSVPYVQKALCDLENDIFKRQIEGVNSQQELFITGLPRAGTTLILNLLYGTGEFRTFTYRHMPFILAPLLWNKVSGPFQVKAATMERAHGDGMEVSYDSPEAFEEIIWLFFMKDKIVSEDRLLPLFPGDQTLEFVQTFKKTIQKLLINENNILKPSPRYLSKNNANFSRIELIQQVFPTSTVLIPFRNPLAHVGSLIKQHNNFIGYHQGNRFAKRYMKWLGHYDFGENFKPINVSNWLDSGWSDAEIDEDFWMMYWTAAYTNILDNLTSNTRLVHFDGLLCNGPDSLKAIADCVELKDKNKLVEAAPTLRSPTSQPIDTRKFSPEILNTARGLYEQLKAASI